MPPTVPRRTAPLCLPRLEVLEERALLSVTPGSLYVAPLPDGSSVAGQLTVAWRPNDTRYAEQWDLNNSGQRSGKVGADINAEAAWNTTTGNSRTVVAVLDSGIDYTHPDLYLNIWVNQKEIPATRRANLIDTNGDGLITFRDLNDKRNQGAGKITDLNGNGRIDGGDLLRPMVKDALKRDTGAGGWADGVSQDGDKYIDDLIGWNSSSNTNNPKDDYGHGTHVAGTVGAIGNNGLGVSGVAWNVQLMPVRFFNGNGQATTQQYVSALEYSLAKGAKISVNSFTDGGYSAEMDAAVKKAHAAGQVYVAAAGNGGQNTDVSPVYPAGFAYDNVLSVGATDRKDAYAPWSNYGKTSVDIAAPGVDILSTNIGSYGTRSGTSMAAPHVAGVVALVWGLRPDWNYRQVINHVLGTGEKLSGLAGKAAHGRVDAAAAVRVPSRGGLQPSSVVVNGKTTSTALRPSSLSPAEAGLGATEAGPSAGHAVAASEPTLVRLPDVLVIPPTPVSQEAGPTPRRGEEPPAVDWLFAIDPWLNRLGQRDEPLVAVPRRNSSVGRIEWPELDV